MAMPRQTHACTCDQCRAAQRMSALILCSFAGGVMVLAVLASLIFT